MKVGGVFAIELLSKFTLKSNTEGVSFMAFPMRSSLTMTTVMPAGPIFFWAPANINPNCKKHYYYNILLNKYL